jgi:DNA-binding response OmpR family regulator
MARERRSPLGLRALCAEGRNTMTVIAMRILVVGTPSAGTVEILRRFSDRGWGSRQVLTVQKAQDLLETFDFDIVLATETLPDGRGYDVAAPIERHSRTLLVGVALSESCLWLPVVERGVSVLGRRALNAQMLEAEMERLLLRSAGDNASAVSSNSTLAGPRAVQMHSATPRHATTLGNETNAHPPTATVLRAMAAFQSGTSLRPVTALPGSATTQRPILTRRKYRDRDHVPI